MSKQSDIILNIVRESCSHPVAEEIYDIAREQMPHISLGTVYRNLGKLSDEGLIRKVCMPNSPVRYDKTLKCHGHGRCTKCGTVYDFATEPAMATVEKQIGSPITSCDFSVEFVCNQCKN